MRGSSNKLVIALLTVSAILAIAACVCSAVMIGSYYLYWRLETTQTALSPHAVDASIPETPAPTLPASAAAEDAVSDLPKPGLADVPDQTAAPSDGAYTTMETLANTQVPINDLIDLAKRLRGVFEITPPSETVAIPLQKGDRQTFWVMDVDEDRNFQVSAKLVYISEHLYFWVEDGLSVNQRALKRLVDAFDQQIYPTNRQFFGSEWMPGIDGDSRLHILYVKGVGNSIAGYFASSDEYPVQVNEFSNMREMFLLNADSARLNDGYTYGVLAHEFQHMIHWYQDRNEETWMNEGFSELAALLNGYDIGNADQIFTQDPDIQLTDWPSKPDPAHYGASFLFLTYFLDRFGDTATQAVVANQANGLTSIDQVLADLDARDNITGKLVRADDVFIDWAVANYLQDGRVGDGRYSYHNYKAAPKTAATEIVNDCSGDPETRQVKQYGADYIRIRCSGDFVLRIEGASDVKLLPTEPHSGKYAFWSNRGDESDMTLTHTFDFKNVTGALTLNYWTWYDIEKGFDQLYLLASEDSGQSWQILTTPSGSLQDLSGNSLGWSYTGQSGADVTQSQWILEQVDLSSLAGKEVQLRFEYVTDAAVNGEGFLVDDVAIPEIGYTSDFEIDDGGWQAQGFARVENALPQTYKVALIEKGQPTRVSLYELSGQNVLEIPIHVGDESDAALRTSEAILVVSGTTRITRQPADYTFQIVR